jgi:hypothetical protein
MTTMARVQQLLVRELIVMLQTLPPEARVYTEDGSVVTEVEDWDPEYGDEVEQPAVIVWANASPAQRAETEKTEAEFEALWTPKYEAWLAGYRTTMKAEPDEDSRDEARDEAQAEARAEMEL